MPGQKILIHDGAGAAQEITTPQIGGVANANKVPSLDNAGRIDQSMMPSSVGTDTHIITASEALSAGDFVNVWNETDVAKVRKADATTSGKPAHGYVLQACTANDPAKVYFEATNTAVTGASAGPVYLDTNAGGFTDTPPSSSGNLVQQIGIVTGATSIRFNPGLSVKLS